MVDGYNWKTTESEIVINNEIKRIQNRYIVALGLLAYSAMVFAIALLVVPVLSVAQTGVMCLAAAVGWFARDFVIMRAWKKEIRNGWFPVKARQEKNSGD